jgi:hypothetical protein
MPLQESSQNKKRDDLDWEKYLAGLEQRMRNLETVLLALVRKEQSNVACVLGVPAWVMTATPVLAVGDYDGLRWNEGGNHRRTSDIGAT